MIWFTTILANVGLFMLASVVLSVLIMLAMQVLAHYSRRGRLLNKIPGPRTLPLFGNMLLMNVLPEDLFKMISNLFLEHGSTYRIWFLTRCTIITRHPDDLEVILSSQINIQKPAEYDNFQPWLRTGLITSFGEKWRLRRKILTPAFHFQTIKKCVEISSKETNKIIKQLRQGGKEFNRELLELCSDISLNIIFESMMGISLKKLDTTFVKKYMDAVEEMSNVIVSRSTKPYLSDWMLPYCNLGKVQERTLKVLHAFIDKILKERREYHEITGKKYLLEFDVEDDKNNVDISSSERKKGLAILDLLLHSQLKGLMDEEGIKEELNTFVFAGYHTLNKSLLYTLMLLAENKEAQDIAREEIRNVMIKCNGKLDHSALQDLTYIERCIQEMMRLYPPVPQILRYVTEDMKLKNYLLPAGSNIFCSIYDLHRNPEFWPEPEKFDPDRFLPECKIKRHPFTYSPFSGGLRNCIGQKFAMLELKLMIAQILYNFFLEPVDRICDMKLRSNIVLSPIHPIYMKFIRINL